MSQNVLGKLALAGAIASSAILATTTTTRADSTCTASLSAKFTNLETHGGGYEYSATIIRDTGGAPSVTYSEGLLTYTTTWGGAMSDVTSGAEPAMAFSNRYSGTQNFTVSHTDATNLFVYVTGSAALFDYTTNTWVFNTDTSCTGNLMTRYVFGLGEVIIQLGAYIAPPP